MMEVFSQPELAQVRHALVESFMRAGFPDMSRPEQEAYAQRRLGVFMETFRPNLNTAIQRLGTAGASDGEIDSMVRGVMEGVAAAFEEALRECGLDIEIVPVQLPPRRRRR